ncbi:hypothetical protein F4802DRAFT_484673 [Xylaria palmicola]|nr:hypothetical protein F4802DRAFT_484673 [Xylaria palmicola]
MEVLYQWLSEASFSLDATLVSMDTYKQNPRVRRAVSKFFSFNLKSPRLSGPRRTIFNTIRTPFFLCINQPAQQLISKANELEDEDGNTITIEDLLKYQELLRKDAKNRSWWAGEITNQNGYYFTEQGGDYFYDDDDDLVTTAAMQLLERNATGQAEAQPEKAAVILCQLSFDGSPQPNI